MIELFILILLKYKLYSSYLNWQIIYLFIMNTHALFQNQHEIVFHSTLNVPKICVFYVFYAF